MFGAEAQLMRFSPRLSTVQQVSEVKVRGYDPENKKEIVGSATPASSPLGDKTGVDITNAKHSNVYTFDCDVPVKNKQEADAIAKAILEERMMSYITGDAVAKGNPAPKDTKEYVGDKVRSAMWLIKSIHQRQRTIYKVMQSIIKHQREFFERGINFLTPLNLRDVADDIEMHESTVSRVVTNKYMHTPQGVFEMKYFFHSGISSSSGEAVSSVTIKQRIRKIIEQEDPRKPLSDSKIVSILQREGLELARRTIAKYREELKIPTSNQRKVLY
jgi:RNA polymerase sigma-54 factor